MKLMNYLINGLMSGDISVNDLQGNALSTLFYKNVIERYLRIKTEKVLREADTAI